MNITKKMLTKTRLSVQISRCRVSCTAVALVAAAACPACAPARLRATFCAWFLPLAFVLRETHVCEKPKRKSRDRDKASVSAPAGQPARLLLRALEPVALCS